MADRSPHRDTALPESRPAVAGDWKLEDAKARFSEVVRRARTDGPQRVTRRGEPAVFIIAAEEMDRLRHPVPLPLISFLESLHVAGSALELDRASDVGRDVEL